MCAFSLLVKFLSDLQPLIFLTQLALHILRECLHVPTNIPHYMKTDCDKIVQCFTNSADSDIRISSIFILSYIECKLSAKQRHHLRMQEKDVQIVLDELSKSVLTYSICSSPTSLLRDMQSVIVAEQENAETFFSKGILSTMSEVLASSDSNVQMETIILIWKLISTPLFIEKVKAQSDLVPAIQRLQISDCSPDLNLAITCVLWDITGERSSGKIIALILNT